MFKKLIERWKSEWWLKHASELAKEYEVSKLELIKKFEDELREINKTWLESKDSLTTKITYEESDLQYRLDRLEERKIEVAKLDADLKVQIKLLEAKAHPSELWATAFTAGADKIWDLIMPVMIGNLDKLKGEITERATEEAIRRLSRGNNKTIK